MPPHSPAERGAVATEYALLVSGIAAAVVLAIVLFGGSVVGLFDDTCAAVEPASSTSC